MSYLDDRNDVAASGDAGARALMTVARYLHGLAAGERCEQNVHLLAHSMGNFALRHAVQGLRRKCGNHLPCLFEKIFLMAADEDNDCFEHVDKMKLLPRLAHEIVVYHTPRDLALVIAENTKGRPERLGSDGPENIRALNDKISVVDVSGVLYADDDNTNHQYYLKNKKVQADVKAVFDGSLATEIPGRVYLPDKKRFRLKGRPPKIRKRAKRASNAPRKGRR